MLLLDHHFAVQGLTTLTADVHSGGITGNVTFTQTQPGESVSVTFALAGLQSASYNWQLGELRVRYDVADRCGLLGAR